MVGLEFDHEPDSRHLPGPFFFLELDSEDVSGDIRAADDRLIYRLFSACRITHRKSGLMTAVHWWASHGRVMEVTGFPGDWITSADIAVLNKCLDLLRALQKAGRKRGTRRYECDSLIREAIKAYRNYLDGRDEEPTADDVAGALGLGHTAFYENLKVCDTSWKQIQKIARKI